MHTNFAGHNVRHFCASAHINFTVQVISSRIKMLPDVGMVKVYPECVLKTVNVDQVIALSRNIPPCSWTFFTSCFFHAATSGIKDTVHHPYLFLWDNIYIISRSIALMQWLKLL